MRRQTSTRRNREGQVIVIAPVLFLAVSLALALSVDVGRIVVEKARMQNACDAAAMAGADVLLDERLAGASETSARNAAEQAAMNVFRANTQEAAGKVAFGVKDPAGSFMALDVGALATLVHVTAYRSDDAPGGELPMLFAGLAGVNETGLEAAATAEVSGDIRAVTANLSPFAIPKGRIPAIGATITFYPGDPDAYDDGLGADLIVPGNWGLLNLDGGDLSTTEMVDWIENGTGSLTIPEDTDYIWIDGTSGFRAALNKTVKGKIGDSILVVVYDQVVGTGATAEFRCVGFLSVTIVDCKLVGANPYASCRVDEIHGLHDLTTGGSTSSLNIRKVQLIG